LRGGDAVSAARPRRPIRQEIARPARLQTLDRQSLGDAGNRSARAEGAAAMTKPPQPVLYLDDVTVSFDGFKALNGLSFVVEPGELRTIIGPNGAGKTTMMDVITGKTRPDKGTAFFKGVHDLTKLDEETIANLGIGRKFQRPTVFDNHTVLENLEL